MKTAQVENEKLEYEDSRLARTRIGYVPKANFQTDHDGEKAKEHFAEYISGLEATSEQYLDKGNFDAADRYKDQIAIETVAEKRFLLGAEAERRGSYATRSGRPEHEVQTLAQLERLEMKTFERVNSRDARQELGLTNPLTESLNIQNAGEAQEGRVKTEFSRSQAPFVRPGEQAPAKQHAAPKLRPLDRTPQVRELRGSSFTAKSQDGAVEYVGNNNKVAFTDSGKNIRVKNAKDDAALAAAIKLSGEKYPSIKLGGSQRAKERAATEAVKQGLGDRITNPEMKDFIKNLQSERSHEKSQEPLFSKSLPITQSESTKPQSDAGKANQARIESRREGANHQISSQLKNTLSGFRQGNEKNQNREQLKEKQKTQTE